MRDRSRLPPIRCVIYVKIVFKKIFQEYHPRVSNRLDPHYVKPDLGPNFFHWHRQKKELNLALEILFGHGRNKFSFDMAQMRCMNFLKKLCSKI